MTSDLRAEAINRLYRSVFLIVSESGSIEERLAKAYFTYIEPMHAAALPVEARERFERIRDELKTMYPANGSVEGVDRAAAVNVAQSLLLLYDDLNP